MSFCIMFEKQEICEMVLYFILLFNISNFWFVIIIIIIFIIIIIGLYGTPCCICNSLK